MVVVLCMGIVTGLPAFAEQYVISGSPDGTGHFIVDDALDVDLNGVQFHSDGNLPSGDRIPIPLPDSAKVGDILRFRVRDTFGNCAGLAPLFLTNSSGCSVLIDPGFTRPCSPDPGTLVAHDYTTTIPEFCVVYTAEQVADICPGGCSSAPTSMTVFNDALYFAANDGTHGRELWRLPIGAAPELVTDIAVGAPGSSPSSLTVAGNTLYFIATTATTGAELFQYDGVNPAGLAADINPGPQQSFFTAGLTALGDEVFFSAWDGVSGGEDLFAFGPGGLRPFNISPDGSNPYGLMVHNGVLYFGAATAATGAELFSCDGVDTSLVIDLVPGGSSNPAGMTGLGDLLIFSASNAFGQRNLHVVDLVTGNHVEINPSVAFDFMPSGFLRMNDLVFFTADDGLSGRELWATDGTAAGTRQVADVYPGPTGSNYRSLIPFQSELLFGAGDDVAGFEIHATNGFGARLVADMAPGFANSDFEGPLALTHALFFASNGGGPWRNPWVTNGTSTGTQVVKKSDGTLINPAGNSMDDTRFTLFDGTPYFAGNDGVSGYELWRIGGGAVLDVQEPVAGAGTLRLRQNRPNPFSGSTRLGFALPRAAKVSLRIIDVAGREVRSLLDADLGPGTHDVIFDARGLESGVYLYQLRVAGDSGSTSVETRKLVLTR